MTRYTTVVSRREADWSEVLAYRQAMLLIIRYIEELEEREDRTLETAAVAGHLRKLFSELELRSNLMRHHLHRVEGTECPRCTP